MAAFAACLAAVSCGDEDDDFTADWMAANQAALNEIRSNPAYTEMRSPGNEGSIYCKVLEKGAGVDSIYYTSTISCYYKGWFAADYPDRNIKKGDVFDQKLFDDGAPATFAVSGTGGVMAGWQTALYGMVKGDRWEIWVPYQLGYGREETAGNGTVAIPGFSTLVFEIEIVGVYNE